MAGFGSNFGLNSLYNSGGGGGDPLAEIMKLLGLSGGGGAGTYGVGGIPNITGAGQPLPGFRPGSAGGGVGGGTGTGGGGIGDLFKNLLGGGGGTGAPSSTPPVNPYLQQIADLAKKFGGMGATPIDNPYIAEMAEGARKISGLHGLPQLDPESMQALAKIKQDSLNEAQRIYNAGSRNLTNRLYAQGIERSTPGNMLAGELQGQFGRAISGIESGAAEREINQRNTMAQQLLANLTTGMGGIGQAANLTNQAFNQNNAAEMAALQGQLGALQTAAGLQGQQDQAASAQARDKQDMLMRLLPMMMQQRGQLGTGAPAYQGRMTGGAGTQPPAPIYRDPNDPRHALAPKPGGLGNIPPEIAAQVLLEGEKGGKLGLEHAKALINMLGGNLLTGGNPNFGYGLTEHGLGLSGPQIMQAAGNLSQAGAANAGNASQANLAQQRLDAWLEALRTGQLSQQSSGGGFGG